MQKVFNLLAVVVLLLTGAAIVRAEPFGRDVFRTRWERTDLPVQRNVANRKNHRVTAANWKLPLKVKHSPLKSTTRMRHRASPGLSPMACSSPR